MKKAKGTDICDLDKCPECGMKWTYKADGKVFSRVIGLEDPSVYDGVSWWGCPRCKAQWDRWTGKLTRKGSADGKATR